MAIPVLHASGDTHPGLHRETNEDRFACDQLRGIFAVIDGVGGETGGDKAAEMALAAMMARLGQQTGSAMERVREAITLANNEIFHVATTQEAYRGMACVLTVALVEDNRVTLGHVGDSRLFLLTPGKVRKVTHDHSLVGEEEDAGRISEIQAMHHPRRCEILRDVGSEEHAPHDEDFIECAEFAFQPDCGLLLCSDGLTDMLTTSRLQAIVEHQAGEPHRVAQTLIAEANKAGGRDNVTVVYVEGQTFARKVRALRRGGLIKGADPRRTRYPAQAGERLNPGLRGRWARAAETRFAFFLYGVLGVLSAGMLLSHLDPQGRGAAWSRSWRSQKVLRADPAKGIGDALHRATKGSIVLVAPGTYDEFVRLKDGVDLVSEQPHAAVIRSPKEPGNRPVAVSAAGIRASRFEGFRIEGSSDHDLSIGIELDNTTVLIEGVEVTGARTAAIVTRNHDASTLVGNHLHDNPGCAVYIGAQTSPKLIHNLILRNGNRTDSERRNASIDIAAGAEPVLRGNVFGENVVGDVSCRPCKSTEEVLQGNFSLGGPLTPSRVEPPGTAAIPP